MKNNVFFGLIILVLFLFAALGNIESIQKGMEIRHNNQEMSTMERENKSLTYKIPDIVSKSS